MATRQFLKPLSALLAALASASAGATVKDSHDPTANFAPLVPEVTSPVVGESTPIAPGTEREVTFRQGGDLFKFVLARTEGGDFVSYHQSHSSHSSHESHSSHSSHYSSR